MLQKFVDKISSKPAKSPFEKLLKKALNSDKTPIQETVLLELLSHLQGLDSNASRYFEILIMKIEKSSKKWVKWPFLLKILMIFDRLLEQGKFIKEIFEYQSDLLINFKSKNVKTSPSVLLIRSFSQYVRLKAQIYGVCSIRLQTYEVSSVSSNTLTSEDLAFLQRLQELVYNIIETCEQGLLKYMIIQSIFEGFLSLLHGFYYLQYDFLYKNSQRFFAFQLEQAMEIKSLCETFINNTQCLIAFINNHQFMKGFSMKNNEWELFQPKGELIRSFDDYIEVLMKKKAKGEFFEQSLSNIETEPHFDERLECDLIESEKELGIQRKQNIFISPIRAHFIQRPSKPWEKLSSSQQEISNSLTHTSQIDPIQPININKKFKFLEKKDLFCLEIFEEFENHYSQTYKGSFLELGDYEMQNFELQVKLIKTDKLLFRRQTLDLSENVDFNDQKPFKLDIFKSFKNSFSSDFYKEKRRKESIKKNVNI